MAQYTVTHACGHTHIHTLFGAGKEREKRLDYLERTDCQECYRSAHKADPPTVYLRAVAVAPLGEGVEVIITNSFAQRDAIKARGGGYQFGEGFYVGPHTGKEFAIRPTGGISAGYKGWSRVFGPADVDALASELRWIESQGWPVREESPNPLRAALAAVMEGRPDVGGLIRGADGSYRTPEQIMDAMMDTPPAAIIEVIEVEK